MSPCEKYVLTSSEDGSIHIWTVESEKIIFNFIPYGTNIAVHEIQFQPSGEKLAVSHYGLSMPILIFGYNEHGKIPLFNLSLKESKRNKLKKTFNTSPEDITNFNDILKKMNDLCVLK